MQLVTTAAMGYYFPVSWINSNLFEEFVSVESFHVRAGFPVWNYLGGDALAHLNYIHCDSKQNTERKIILEYFVPR